MTKRLPVSAFQNTWFDSQQVDSNDLLDEQTFNDQINSATIQNHFGSGILPAVLSQPVLFDSSLTVGLLDGKPILTQKQPSDTQTGVQLEVELSRSAVFGKKTVKVCVIGLDLNNNIQYDTFVFKKNEKQTTSKHYIHIVSILFNDLLGAEDKSFNLGGTVLIRESSPVSVSRDAKSLAQDIEPNLFFRDFFIDPAYSSLFTLLQAAVPGYNVDSLGISTSYRQLRKLPRNDVVTQIGQKFAATSNNIQKITVLLSVENDVTPSDLSWTGDLVLSLYALQSSVACSTDIVPQLAIDFSPTNIPLAQASLNFATLQTAGSALDGYLQPIDFLFSNTNVANGGLTVGSYYAWTLKRAGSADKCNILTAAASNKINDSHVTIFNGSVWADIKEEDLWFQIWSDAIKVSDGQAYDAGFGITIPKTKPDPMTGIIEDWSQNNISFTTTRKFIATISAATEESGTVQDQRTGNPVFSRKQTVPKIELLLPDELDQRKLTTEPLTIATIQDRNVKSIDISNATIVSKINQSTIFKNELLIKIIDDNTDPNINVNLVTAFNNGDLIGARLIPNTTLPNIQYRIGKAEICTMLYGDVDGNGIVDDADLALATGLLGKSVGSSPTIAKYLTDTNYFVTNSGVTYNIYDATTLTVIYSGICTLTVLPSGIEATITDASAVFTGITNILTYKVVVTGSFDTVNIGTFDIIFVQNGTNIRIRKFYTDSETYLRILRSDIDGNGTVGVGDVSLLTQYVEKIAPVPITTSPGNRIGTPFKVMKLQLERLVDRSDDYPYNIANRATILHPRVDIVLSDTSLAARNYTTTPSTLNIIKTLTWSDDLIMTNGQGKLVACTFSGAVSTPLRSCEPKQVECGTYPVLAGTDPGRNDFFIPNNLIIGETLQNKDGSLYKMDLEIGTIVLEVPTILFLTEKTINIFTDFVAEVVPGSGVTRIGYPAMKFSDCSFVPSLTATAQNQVRFSASIQSFYADLAGVSTDGYSGVIVDHRMGLHIDYVSGLLRMNFAYLLKDPTKLSLNTKVQIQVYLKKSGFNNNFVNVDASKLTSLLGL